VWKNGQKHAVIGKRNSSSLAFRHVDPMTPLNYSIRLHNPHNRNAAIYWEATEPQLLFVKFSESAKTSWSAGLHVICFFPVTRQPCLKNAMQHSHCFICAHHARKRLRGESWFEGVAIFLCPLVYFCQLLAFIFICVH
jgi:hypothetical protein